MSAFPKLNPATLPKLTAWSYSRYNDYQTCPMRFAYKHLLRIKEPGSPAMERGSAIHKEAEQYVTAARKPRSVPPSLANFAQQFEELRKMGNVRVEQQWGFRQDWTETGWFDRDVWVRNVLDVCVLYDDHTADVIDHKTGKKYVTNEDQMQLFALVTFRKFPDVTDVTTRLWYLDLPDREGNEVVMEYARREADSIQRDWEKKVKPMFVDRRFPPRPNPKCRWCFLSKDKGGPCKF